MSFDYAKAFEAIATHKDVSDVSAFMTEILDACKAIEPSEGWDKFAGLDYQNESESLSNHVVSVLQKEPAKFDEKGFWFGINNPVLESGETIAGLYFSVSSSFDPENEDADWACNAEHYPEAGYFNSGIMANLYRLAYSESGLGNKAEYTLCLAYALRVAEKAMKQYIKSFPDKQVGYAVGFDSGDFINMGWAS
ncbi:hypothetical protein KJI95_14350 [Shewanella sp. JM162201]|uniref:Uncharacterized protein n=1 Tax=Shewanella jiangmenensis TaxID=2837387 RepID=A0ABS5V5F3_9GAMM|nr:hypothetical protein [Shewanella jiangmenensis]MBT1445692.1 hypothetical protein [Shewanella jiangmenensis]